MNHAIHPVYVNFRLPSQQINAFKISKRLHTGFTFSNKMLCLFNHSFVLRSWNRSELQLAVQVDFQATCLQGSSDILVIPSLSFENSWAIQWLPDKCVSPHKPILWPVNPKRIWETRVNGENTNLTIISLFLLNRIHSQPTNPDSCPWVFEMVIRLLPSLTVLYHRCRGGINTTLMPICRTT